MQARRKAYGWCLVAVVLGGALNASAQQISQSQIDQFRQLPESQQRELAQQHGFDLDDLEQRAATQQRQQERPEEVEVVETDAERRDEDERDEAPPERERADREDAEERELQPFGYDLFRGEPSTFAPVTEIPLPLEYIIGPGDVIELQLFGNENMQLELPVSRDGTINLPDSGPMAVAGMTYEALTERLSQHVQDTFIGTRASVSLGALRSMRVFILGEARHPGSYSVSSLSTLSNALMVSGGISETGSLRNVQLMREGEVVATIDLYEFLLEGSTESDLRLQPGDAVFIPPVGDRVMIDGEVRRPAIYELVGGETVSDLVALAGGYHENAALSEANIHRVEAGRTSRSLKTVDLSTEQGRDFELMAADRVMIPELGELDRGYVRVRGAAESTGQREWREGLRLSDLVDRHRVRREADLNYALLVREVNEQGDIEVHQFRPLALMGEPGGGGDRVLEERDEVIFFPRKDPEPPEEPEDGQGQADRDRQDRRAFDEEDRMRERERLLAPVIEQLKRQASPEQPQRVASVSGGVRFAGDYPLPDNANAQQMIEAAGGLVDSALMREAEVVRMVVGEDGQPRTELESFALTAGLDSGASDIAIGSRDRLLIKRIPRFDERETVELEGEVRFPGEYTIQAGETLNEVIERAGGLTDRAFPDGAVFSRERLREAERERLEQSQQRLRRDLLGLQFRGSDNRISSDQLNTIRGLIADIQQVEAAGRLVIDLERVIEGDHSRVELVDGDRLTVPRRNQTVSVFGEVQSASSHLYDEQLTLNDYVERSGGFTSQADEDRIYVIRANGAIWRPSDSRWFDGTDRTLEPGDTIVAPIDLDRLDLMALSSNVSGIFSDLAVSAAALRSF